MHESGEGRRAVVLGNDQRVAVVIFKHRRVCAGLTGLLSADGSIMTALIYDLSLSHSTTFLSFSLNTPRPIKVLFSRLFLWFHLFSEEKGP